MLFDACDKVIGIFLVCVSNSKVVDDKGEADIVGLVEKETSGVFCWDVAVLGKAFFEVIVCNAACLF